ncbi:MAG: dephospho-CoA kinase [Geovibrio sp.]|nr:dephospho-CoA kinase [Geovibrio sp.]MCD8567601.1 dephospho-CoA kinase [Geovibrio sp.]
MYLGLTGNIACGKSTVAKMFERLGCYTIDTDILSRRVMAQGGAAYPLVVDTFGVDVLDNEGNIDRAALRSIVFNDDAARKRLEEIVHPAILKAEAKLVGEIKGKDDRAIILTQAALCVETGAYTRFDGLVVVYCEPEEQRRRLMDRDDITGEEAEKIIRTQMPIDEKLKYANFVVNNSGTVDETEKDVKRVFDLITLMKQAMRQKG